MAFVAVNHFTDELGRTVYYDAAGTQSLLPNFLAHDDKEIAEAITQSAISGRNPVQPTAPTQPTQTGWTADQKNSIATTWNNPNVSMQEKADWLRQNNVSATQLADILKATGQANTTDLGTLPQQITLALSQGDKNYKRGDYGTLLGITDTYGTPTYKPQTTDEFLAALEKQNASNKAEWDRGVRAGPVSATDTFKPATAPAAVSASAPNRDAILAKLLDTLNSRQADTPAAPAPAPATAAPVQQAPAPQVNYASAPTIDQSRYTNYGGVQLPPGEVKQWAPAATPNYGGEGVSGRQTAINALLGINAK